MTLVNRHYIAFALVLEGWSYSLVWCRCASLSNSGLLSARGSLILGLMRLGVILSRFMFYCSTKLIYFVMGIVF